MEKKPIFNFNLPEDSLKTWTGELYKLEKLPDGKFVEVKLGENKVLLGGLQKLCYALYGKQPKVKVATIEEDLAASAADDFTNNLRATGEPDRIMGYNVAYDGSQGTDVIAYPKHKKGYNFDNLIPFRLIPEGDNNYDEYMQYYLHSRVVTIEDADGAEHRYVAYYTKKVNIDYTVTTDDSSEVPDNPDSELHTDKDIRVLASFLVNITDKELREWFSIFKKGKMESTGFNALMTVMGKPAKLRLAGKEYDSLTDSVIFSRINHVMVPHGVDGTIACTYKMIHI